MNESSPDQVDQSLFGYSDGHRQLATSFRLPTKDLFVLSSASDLAGGVQLEGEQSYLTGVPLPESKRYALLRTWAAPEMTRPGCVWSHALLLDAKTMSSVASFSSLLELFRRPASDHTVYSKPLTVRPLSLPVHASLELISIIIDRYYTGKSATIAPNKFSTDEIERSILAVWSQQWPRLRSTFSFCTADVKDRRRTDVDRDVQFSSYAGEDLSSAVKWALTGALDASLNKVTPLRRFLWRYGRDVSSSRRFYKVLVNLFSEYEHAETISVSAAFDVLSALPDPLDGAVIKRDMLGFGPKSPRLIPAISAVDFIKLLPSGALSIPPTSEQVGQRLGDLSTREIGEVTRFYYANRDALSPWKEVIRQSLISLADKSSLLNEYPPDLAADVLLSRHDLIDADVLRIVGNDVLPRLIGDDLDLAVARVVMTEMLRRDMGPLGDILVSTRPEFVFQSVVESLNKMSVDQSWLRTLARHAGAILTGAWLSNLRSTTDFAAALSVLHYPRDIRKPSAEIARRLAEILDDAQGEQRSTMQAALLRTSLDEGSEGSWDLISLILPELRVVIINAGLSQTAELMLINDLPHFYSADYWDLDKRILLSLSRLYATAPNALILNKLSLSGDDQDVIANGERPSKNPFKFWWP